MILVTGGCGFIGSHLVQRLRRDGQDVSILDTFLTGHPSNLGDDALDCSIIQGSVTNWDAVRRAMNGCHVVYHLAARHDWSQKRRHPMALGKTNAWGTDVVLTMARAMGVHKVVFTSSASVYGNVYPGAEGDPCRPCSIVGATKLAAEAYCHGFNALGQPEVVILRLFNVYGPRGHGVVNVFQDGGNVIYGDGLQTRDFVHVSDVISALVAAQQWDAGVYNVGTGVETTIEGLWRVLRGDEEPEYEPFPPWELGRSFADTTKVEGLWKPHKELVTGI